MKLCLTLLAFGASAAVGGPFFDGGNFDNSGDPRRLQGHTDQGSIGGPSTIDIEILVPGNNGDRRGNGDGIVIDFDGFSIGGVRDVAIEPPFMPGTDGGSFFADERAPTSSVVPAPGVGAILIGGTLAARRRRR